MLELIKDKQYNYCGKIVTFIELRRYPLGEMLARVTAVGYPGIQAINPNSLKELNIILQPMWRQTCTLKTVVQVVKDGSSVTKVMN